MKNVPAEYRARYDRIVKSNGRQFADDWLSRKTGGSKGSEQSRDSRPARRVDCCKFSCCAADYARVIRDPFDALPVGMPSAPAMPSQKVKCYVKGNLDAAGGSFGAIVMSPKTMIANDNAAPNESVYYSNSLYALTTLPTSASANTNHANSNSPYVVADVGDSAGLLQYRVVSAGIRVRYIGTELNRGGAIYKLTHPYHQSVAGYTDVNMLAYEAVHAEMTDRKWHEVTWYPVTPLEHDYSSVLANVHNIGILLACPDDAAFEFECVCNFEVIGANVRGKTATPTDTKGMYSLLSAASQHASHGSWSESLNGYMNQAAKLVEEGTTMVTNASTLAGAVQSGYKALNSLRGPGRQHYQIRN